jgi:hypothetical protein
MGLFILHEYVNAIAVSNSLFQLLTAICRCVAYVEFEVLTAVVIMSSIFWDIMPCSGLPPTFTLVSCCSAHSSTLKMEATCSYENRLNSKKLHGAISQKIELLTYGLYLTR